MTPLQWIGVAIGSALAVLIQWASSRRRREIEERLRRLEDRR